MVKLITENGKMTELIPLCKVMVRTLPLRCKLQKFALVYPDGYSAVFEPPKKKKMNKIKIDYDESKLGIVIHILAESLKALPKTQEENKNHSIAKQLLMKLRKRQVDRTYKVGNFKVIYEVYEAIVFEQILRANFEICRNEYQRNTVRAISDKINKLTS